MYIGARPLPFISWGIRWIAGAGLPSMRPRRDAGTVKAAEPLPVWMWLVMSRGGDYRAKAEALAWTATQVWANAVQRR